jgi:hypothetical protein
MASHKQNIGAQERRHRPGALEQEYDARGEAHRRDESDHRNQAFGTERAIGFDDGVEEDAAHVRTLQETANLT